VTGGQVHDSQVVSDVLNTPKPPLANAADKAYDSQKVRQHIKDEGALPIIPSRCNAATKSCCPKPFYRRRRKIENYFCRIKDWRRIATRYDKLAHNFLTATPLVGALYWIELWVQTLNCSVPLYDGTDSRAIDKDGTWARFCTGAPARRRRSVERYSIVKRA
jgi:transposase